MVKRLQHLIGKHLVQGDSATWGQVYDPATGTLLAEVPLDAGESVTLAVREAVAAFPSWKATPILHRARVMFRYRELLERYREDLARMVTLEHGKTLDDANGEVGRGIEVVEVAASAPSLLKGETLTDVARGIDTTMVRVPLGVVAGITPFNFPAMIPLWMMPLALVAGNSFILKPSERTPLTSMRLAELLFEAGLPEGVLNVVHGGRETVDALLSSPEVKAISFVGSQPVAEYVYRTASGLGKRVQALGGAKNYHVVMADADLTRTVPALMQSAFGAAGERCLAGSVVIAVGDVAGPLLAHLRNAADRWRVGSGLDADVDMGPLIRAEHRDRVAGYVEAGIEEGAELIRDGRTGDWPTGGFFLGPTIFDRVQPEMTIAREEIFGPVLSVIREPDLPSAVRTANRSRFGNTATIYTESGGAARYFREHIEAGMVGVNVGVAAPVAVFPFAGWKQSFYGDLHATGMDGLLFYTERQVITARWWGGNGSPRLAE
ncbi:MAG: CoA-acylating methylmalonate-semialdehyde dehydrogenase [Thermaerobacter sp.]|nr:CoA-acylating methylmalonate-semialdehyde dehydrogenase [Thermaerobacter sp.]